MLNVKAREAADTIFKFLGMTQLRIKPSLPYFAGERSNTRPRSWQTLYVIWRTTLQQYSNLKVNNLNDSTFEQWYKSCSYNCKTTKTSLFNMDWVTEAKGKTCLWEHNKLLKNFKYISRKTKCKNEQLVVLSLINLQQTFGSKLNQVKSANYYKNKISSLNCVKNITGDQNIANMWQEHFKTTSSVQL